MRKNKKKLVPISLGISLLLGSSALAIGSTLPSSTYHKETVQKIHKQDSSSAPTSSMMDSEVRGNEKGTLKNYLENNPVENGLGSRFISANGGGGTLIPLKNVGLSFISNETGRILCSQYDTEIGSKVIFNFYHKALNIFIILYLEDGNTIRVVTFDPDSESFETKGAITTINNQFNLRHEFAIAPTYYRDESGKDHLSDQVVIFSRNFNCRKFSKHNVMLFTTNGDSFIQGGLATNNDDTNRKVEAISVIKDLKTKTNHIALFEIDEDANQSIWVGSTASNSYSFNYRYKKQLNTNLGSSLSYSDWCIPVPSIKWDTFYPDTEGSFHFKYIFGGNSKLSEVRGYMYSGDEDEYVGDVETASTTNDLSSICYSSNGIDDISLGMLKKDNTFFKLNMNSYNTSKISEINNTNFKSDDVLQRCDLIKNAKVDNFGYPTLTENNGNLFGFTQSSDDLWCINLNANSKAGSWAYESGTSWIKPVDDLMQITTLKGAEEWNKKHPSTISVGELQQVVFNNISKFFKYTPSKIKAKNVIINFKKKDDKVGTLQADVKLNYIVNNDGVESEFINESDYVGGTILFTGFKTDKATNWASTAENAIDIRTSPWNKSVLATMPTYFLDKKIILYKNFIVENLDYFFKNLSVENISHENIIIDPNDIDVNPNSSSVTFAFTINKGVKEDGSIGDITLPKKRVTIHNLQKPIDTVIEENKSLSFNKSDKKISELTPSQIAELVKINTQNFVVWKKDKRIGDTNWKSLVKDTYNPEVQPFYNTKNERVDIERGNSCVSDNLWSYQTFGYSHSATIDICSLIGAKDQIKIESLNANDDAGTVDLKVTAQNCFYNGKVQTKETILSISGFKTKNTTVKSGNLDFSDKLPSEVSNNDIIKQMIAKNYIVDTKGSITNSNVLIESRVDNNITGIIKCNIVIKNNKALINGKEVPQYTFNNIILTGFKTHPATKFVSSRLVDGSDIFSSKYATNRITIDDIKNYILSHKDKFFNNLLEPINSSNIVIPKLFPDVTKGQISFRINLNKYINESNGAIINSSKNMLDSISHFTIKGFKKDNLNTTCKNTFNLDLSKQTASSTDINSLKQLIINKGNIIEHTNEGQPLNANDIDITRNSYNDVTGTLNVNITIKNDKGWKNGDPNTLKFNNILITGFKKIPATSYNYVTTIDGNSIFKNIVATNRVTDQTIIDFIYNHKNQFFNNLVDGTTKSDISISNKSANLIDGSISFDIHLSKYMDSKTGHLITKGKTLDTTKSFKITGFKNRGYTTTLDNSGVWSLSGVNNLLPSELNDNNLQLKESLLNMIKTKVHYLANDINPTTLTTNDFKYELVPNSASNINWSVRLNITIKNNKAWMNGIASEMTFNNINICGLKVQKQTAIRLASIQAQEYAVNSASALTIEQAKRLLQNNLNNIFDNSAPKDSVISDVKISSTDSNVGTAEVKFKLSKYFDNKGVLVNRLSPEYTININNFTTMFTALKDSTISLPDINNIYSTDQSINESWIKEKITNTMFNNLPAKYDMKSNLTISNIRNSWNDNSVPFGTVKFDMQLSNVYTSDGSGNASFKNISINGFKIANSTTTLIRNNININLPDTSVEEAINNPTLKDSILNIIINSHKSNPIFKDLVPGTSLDKTTLSITKFNSKYDNHNGNVNVSLKLNRNANWINGIKQDKTYDIRLTGFKSYAVPTQWSDHNNISLDGMENIKLDTWDKNAALDYVVKHQNQFIKNVGVGYNDKDIEVELLNPNYTSGNISIKVSLAHHNGSDGQPSTQPFSKIFILNGFMKESSAYTSIQENASETILKNMILNKKWKSSYVADIIQNKKESEKQLLEWLKVPENAKVIFNNFSINGINSEVTSVLLREENNYLKCSITVKNAICGLDVPKTKTFDLNVTNALATPNINVNGYISTTAYNKIFNNCCQDAPLFKQNLATELYSSISSQVNSNQFPIKVKSYFPLIQKEPEQAKSAIKKIESVIQVNNVQEITSASISKQSWDTIFPGSNIEAFSCNKNTIEIHSKTFNWLVIVLSVSFAIIFIIFLALLIVYSKALKNKKEHFYF